MKFREYISLLEAVRKRRPDIQTSNGYEFYSRATKATLAMVKEYRGVSREEGESANAQMVMSRAIAERAWLLGGRPYYKVWPAFIDVLLKLKLDVKPATLQIKQRVIAVRFPHDHHGLSPVLVAAVGLGSTLERPEIAEGDNAAALIVCTSVTEEVGERRIAHIIDLSDDSDVSSKLDQLTEVSCDDLAAPSKVYLRKMISIAFGVLLLSEDPFIIEPDVLSKDQKKYDETKNKSLIEKARRRGKNGWHLGRSYESIPHFRRPHFALRYTGKGGSVPRIRPVRGCVVHREKVTKVPTGHLSEDGTEIEN